MEAAVIVDHTGLLQNQGAGLFRRHRHVPVAISRRRGMDENILVDPFDGVADFRRRRRWRDHEILHRDLNGRRMRRDGRSQHQRGHDRENPPRRHGRLFT